MRLIIMAFFFIIIPLLIIYLVRMFSIYVKRRNEKNDYLRKIELENESKRLDLELQKEKNKKNIFE